MNKSNKIWVLSLFSILIIVSVIGFFVKSNFKDSGLSGVKQFRDFDNIDIRITSPLGKINEELSFNQYNDHMDDIVKILSNSSLIAVVEPTGKLDIGEQSLGQEFIVKSIIKGNLSVGDQANVFLFSGFSVDNRSRVQYDEVVNLMKPSNEYLIFLEESQLNGYTNKNNFLSVVPPSYFNLSQTESQLVTTLDIKWKNNSDSEFFVSTQRILDEVYRLKEILFAQYNLNK